MSDSTRPIWTARKDPDAVLDYTIDWNASAASGGPWLVTGDTIKTSVWVVPAGITKVSDTKSTTVTTVWLSGGTAGETYDIVNRITTDGGRTDDRTIRIIVEER
jgi:hypothetical protein